MKEKKLQEVCRVWKKKFKPDEEKENGGKKVKNEHSDAVKFYHEVNSLAFSNGMRLKAKAQLISQVSWRLLSLSEASLVFFCSIVYWF